MRNVTCLTPASWRALCTTHKTAIMLNFPRSVWHRWSLWLQATSKAKAQRGCTLAGVACKHSRKFGGILLFVIVGRLPSWPCGPIISRFAHRLPQPPPPAQGIPLRANKGCLRLWLYLSGYRLYLLWLSGGLQRACRCGKARSKAIKKACWRRLFYHDLFFISFEMIGTCLVYRCWSSANNSMVSNPSNEGRSPVK